jgi:hypothetical protein
LRLQATFKTRILLILRDFVLFKNPKKRVTEKGFITFAARGGRGVGKADRRESDETAR